MKKTTIISLLLLSTVSVTPAFANYFANPHTNTMLNIGSAPSPTPEMLRAIGDSNYVPPPPRGAIIPPAGPTYVEPASPLSFDVAPMQGTQMRAADLEYKTVFGAGGERLGTVIAFDENAQLAEVQLSTGVAVAMPAALIAQKNGRLMAATVSHNDVLAMAKTQMGRTVAVNVTFKPRNTRA